MLGPYRRVELRKLPSESSEAERRADGAERELMEWKTAQFMESHLGEEYDALIISVQKFGFFVELVEIFVEGLGEHRSPGGNDWPAMRLPRPRPLDRHRAASRLARRKGASAFSALGDRVRVRAERIDPLRHRVEFSSDLRRSSNAYSVARGDQKCRIPLRMTRWRS